MNRTEAVKAHKLTASMVTALESASYRESDAKREGHTGYVIHDVHPRTRKALHDRGLMFGHYYVTAEGVNVIAALAGNKVDAAMMSAPGVEIQDMPSAPEFDAPGAAECYFGCGSPVVAVFVDYVGRTEGLCASHRDRVEGQTYDVPATPENGSQDVQEETSVTTNPHVIVMSVNALKIVSPGAYNRFVGIGESQGVPGSLFTYGLATAISAAPGMNGTGKVNVPVEFGDVITVLTSIGERRYVVERKAYSDPILKPYTTDDVRCYVCQTHGDNSMEGKNIDGEWVCGYCVALNRTPANLNSHSLTFYVETENAGTKYECGDCGSIDSRGGFAEYECDDDSDAGFVETDSVDAPTVGELIGNGYATIAKLSTGAGFHTVEESRTATPTAPVATGTTHHTMDTQGNTWERFEHVLTVGDVVKVIGEQGVYEVHCLIPGLPVVYVLGTVGEPFPVPASKVYAL